MFAHSLCSLTLNYLLGELAFMYVLSFVVGYIYINDDVLINSFPLFVHLNIFH